MAKLLTIMAHPGLRHSRANKTMWAKAQAVDGITAIDLYARYPRFDIDVDAEQQLLREHDVILFQYPLFWYQTPALLKEWLDLVLEYGFAYGTDGDKLAGKTMMLAITTGGPEDAYTREGYQHHTLSEFLAPMRQTATLCQMKFATPYVMYGALQADDTELNAHAIGYELLLQALRDDRFDLQRQDGIEVYTRLNLPVSLEV